MPNVVRAFAVVALLVSAVACTKDPPGSSAGASSGGGSGESKDPDCPKDLSGSVGSSCSSDGKLCSTGAAATHMIMCTRGKWVEMEAPPPPHS